MMTHFADEEENAKPSLMAIFRLTGLPDDAYSEWLQGRKSDEAAERAASNASERSYGND